MSDSSTTPTHRMAQRLRISPSTCERAVGAKPGSEHIVARLKAMDKDGNGEVRAGEKRRAVARARHSPAPSRPAPHTRRRHSPRSST